MSPNELPLDVQALVTEHIETHEQLATILLLRSDPSRWWSKEAIAYQLKLGDSIAEETVRHLVAHGLVTTTDHSPVHYRYAPKTEKMDQSVKRLALAQETHWLNVTNLITKNAIARARSSVADAFANAFVLRRRKEPNRDG